MANKSRYKTVLCSQPDWFINLEPDKTDNQLAIIVVGISITNADLVDILGTIWVGFDLAYLVTDSI